MGSSTSVIEVIDDTHVAFAVANVKPKTELPEYFNKAERAFREQTDCKDKLEDFSHNKDTKTNLIHSDMNGIMSAVHFAYINHYPLKLSVSDFILMIAQGLAKHMEVHAEDLRPHFVDFQGKEKITVGREDLIPGANNDWSTVFETFADEIKTRVKTDLHDIMIDNTSVATKLSKIASEIAIMDAFKQYFEYQVMCICGIPKITLVGGKDDWEKLRSKVKKLKELNTGDKLQLDWWLKRLIPLVNTIVDQATSEKINASFWQNIYQWTGPSRPYDGSPMISGWINIFNPYLIDNFDEQIGENGHKDVYKPKLYRNIFGEVHPNRLPSGTSKVPFVWIAGEKEIPMSFHGGFLGAEILADTTIQPVYFYAVTYDSK